MKKPRIIGGYQNTKLNNEDIALTPYLFGVCMNGMVIKIFGIGLCWLHHSVYIGIGFNAPKDYPSFKVLSLKDKT